jgi:phage-related protein
MWTIEYYSERVQNEIYDLPTSIGVRYVRMTDLLIEFGPNLGMPHTRAMGDGLFELRVKGREGIARVFYCTVIGQRIIILHSFVKKSEKTPKRELETARRRQKEVKP